MKRPVGETRSRLSERDNDLYETPPVAVRALLEVEVLPRQLWEPACGPGSIVRVLRAFGHEVYATDLVDYSSPDQDAAGIDFLMEHGSRPGGVITNPPYRLAEAFIEHALTLCPNVYMLLRLGFLEGMRRTVLLEHSGLQRIYLFRNRLPMMHRAGWEGNKSTSRMAFAWYCWRRGYTGPVELRRISWRRE